MIMIRTGQQNPIISLVKPTCFVKVVISLNWWIVSNMLQVRVLRPISEILSDQAKIFTGIKAKERKD